jgi:hypothetical protein
MRVFLRAFCCVLVLSAIAFAQSSRGTITGTITDPAGAVISGATVIAKNTATGSEYPTVTTNTGNYTLSQLPTGPYELSISVSGFKAFVRTGLTVLSAQTLRIDATLEIGALTETVSVSAAAPLLKTESGEMSTNIQIDTLNALPVLTIGNVGQTGIRNPLAVTELLPGADWIPDGSVKVNGAPSNTQGIRVEGQDATNNLWQQMARYTQMGVDAVQEMAIQTSNYAPEFGTAGTAIFNLTMKSGTNDVHGSAYEYFVNEALNAGTPFTEDGTGAHLRPRTRRNDFGFTFGGPVYLPKIYDGRDKLFFFFNFEEYRQTRTTNNFITVPTAAMRVGDFQAVQGTTPLQDRNGNVINDILGREIYQNTIYDPNTERLVNGVRVWDAFPNNIIPSDRMDPAALAVQSYMPSPSGDNASGSINNALVTYPSNNITWIASVKADYSFSQKAKVSGFWSRNYSISPFGADGLAPQISSDSPITFVSHTIRLSFDYTIKPTMMLHLGAGFIQNVVFYDCEGKNPQGDLLIPGGVDVTPRISSLNLGGFGGFSPGIGGIMDVRLVNLKPTANPSLLWIKGNHSIKFGGELIVESHPSLSKTYANNYYYFNAGQTADPSLTLSGITLPSGTAIGFPYASFLLGGYNMGNTNAPSRGHLGSHAIAFYAQDSWKITPKITLDYGLRYDFQTYLKEQYGRMGSWSPTEYNPQIDRPGAISYEGYAPGHCNCEFAKNYPYAFGPRLGLAWQLAPKTVLRVGAGISYGRTSELGYINNMMSNAVFFSSPGPGYAAGTLSTGVPPQYKVTWPTTNTGAYPHLPSLDMPPVFVDHNAGRPARTIQWSFGIQREITEDLLLDVSYVGNRGAWWYTRSMTDINGLTPEYLQSEYGLDINNANDRNLLVGSLASAQAAYPGRFPTPFTGFPTYSSLAQALTRFPQVQYPPGPVWAPQGRTWYDSLQANLTKRFAHNFSFNYNFSFQKEMTIGAEASYFFAAPRSPLMNDVLNRSVNKYISGLSRPFLSNLSVSYTTPRIFSGTRWLSAILRDWQITALFRYSSAYPLQVPSASSNIQDVLARNVRTTFANRVPGQPLFTDQNGNAIDINSRDWDPSQTFVLNPNAWEEPADGKFGASTAYFNDYRGIRHPQEGMGLARNFRFGREGRINLQLRAEFTNIFNRTYFRDPNGSSLTSYRATQTTNPVTGQPSGGFGYINVLDGQTASNVRSGMIVARFSF